MLGPRFEILGKSHFALAVIFDILSLRYPDGCDVRIISNIDASQNTSIDYRFDAKGVRWTHVHSDQYTPNPEIPKILGSIGKSRKAIVSFFAKHHGVQTSQYLSLIHPDTILGSGVQLGNGVHIGPRSTISPHCTIGDFCVVNRHVSVGHHTILEPFSCLNPGVTVAGLCTIGAESTIGAGTTIIDQLTVGEATTIGAGSLVTKSIPRNVVAYGSPAHVIRKL